MSGEITLKKHNQFVYVMQRTMDVIIHNEDVDWLHLKTYFLKILFYNNLEWKY